MDIDRRNRMELKSYFVKNSIPTEKNFADLIDGMLNQKEDGILKLPGEPLSLQAAGDQTSLKKVINFYDDFATAKPAWTLSLKPRIDPGNQAKPGWNLSDGDGKSRLFVDRSTGDVGVGTLSPKSLLDVGGFVQIGEKREGSRLISFSKDADDADPAGTIAYKPSWGKTALCIVGAGKDPNRKIGLWDDVSVSGGLTVGKKVHIIDGTLTIDKGGIKVANGNLDVGGFVQIGGSASKMISFSREAGDHENAGTIAYKPSWAATGLCVVGAGKHPNREIRLCDNVSIAGSLTMEDHHLRFRKGPDKYDGVAWHDKYAGITVNGPVLFGHDGGALGITKTNPEDIALRWNKPDATDKEKFPRAWVEVLTGSNPIRFTSKWSSFADEKGSDGKYKLNQAEICNDTDEFKALMIAGNRRFEDSERRVQVYDRLEVCGTLVQRCGLIKCAKSATWKGDPNNWKEEKDHPVRKYFRDKLKDQPSGTIVFAMSDQWEVRIFFGWVNKDNKARLGYMEIAYETDVG
jgi:hypothetical protein